jgi:FkbM family methyltransferase
LDIVDYLAEYDRALYLDIDIVCLGTLDELISLSIEDKFAAVVGDFAALQLGLNDEVGNSSYFNAGVMLLNLHRMREHRVKRQCLDFLESQSTNRFLDQDAFNKVFGDEVVWLNPRYNLMYLNNIAADREAISSFYGLSLVEMEYFTSNPVILHLAGKDKPWKGDGAPFGMFWNVTREMLKSSVDTSRISVFSSRLSSLYLLRKLVPPEHYQETTLPFLLCVYEIDRHSVDELFIKEVIQLRYDLIERTNDLVNTRSDLTERTNDLVNTRSDLIERTNNLVDTKALLEATTVQLVKAREARPMRARSWLLASQEILQALKMYGQRVNRQVRTLFNQECREVSVKSEVLISDETALAGPESDQEKERQRLYHLPRYIETVTSLPGFKVSIPDGQSFMAVWREAFELGVYDFPSSSSDPRILDCGANVGVVTLYLKTRFPQARITAFEPDPRIFGFLEGMMIAAGYNDVELVQKAVWSSTTVLGFEQEGSDAGRLGEQDTEGCTSVETIRLRDYLVESVDLLKIDIEGAETEVLIDCVGYLNNVRLIFVEYHSFANKPQTLDVVLGILREAGFRVQVQPINGAKRPFTNVEEYLGMDLQLNIFGFRSLVDSQSQT